MIPLEETQKVLTDIIEMVKDICSKAKDFSLSIFMINKGEWRILMPPQNSHTLHDYIIAAAQYLKNIDYDGIGLVNIVDINSATVKDKLLIAYFIPKMFEKGKDSFTSVFSSVKPGWEFGENRVGLVQYRDGVIFDIMPLQ